MDRPLILETTFLIDLERERLLGRPDAAHRFLEANRERRLSVTLTTAGEVAAGATPRERAGWDELLERFDVLPIGLEVCWRYGRIFRYLKENGLLIGTNDLWIAATALAHGLPVVTRNARHFRRVPDLEVIGYTEE